MLEDAPAGPIELDTTLLYSPAGSEGSKTTSSEDSVADQLEFGLQRAVSPLPAASLHQSIAGRAGRPPLAERLQALRRQHEQAEMEECTFKPQVGRPPALSRAQPGIPVEQRLLQAAGQARRAAERRILEERKDAEEAECTFAPQLNTRRRVFGEQQQGQQAQRRPLHQRLAEEDRRRAAMLAAATAKADAEATFRPQLNPISLRLAAERRHAKAAPGKAAISNTSTGGPTAAAGAHLLRLGKSQAEAGPTFEPAINSLSARMLEVSSTVPSDFHLRQRYFDQRHDERRQALLAAEVSNQSHLPIW